MEKTPYVGELKKFKVGATCIALKYKGVKYLFSSSGIRKADTDASRAFASSLSIEDNSNISGKQAVSLIGLSGNTYHTTYVLQQIRNYTGDKDPLFDSFQSLQTHLKETEIGDDTISDLVGVGVNDNGAFSIDENGHGTSSTFTNPYRGLQSVSYCGPHGEKVINYFLNEIEKLLSNEEYDLSHDAMICVVKEAFSLHATACDKRISDSTNMIVALDTKDYDKGVIDYMSNYNVKASYNKKHNLKVNPMVVYPNVTYSYLIEERVNHNIDDIAYVLRCNIGPMFRFLENEHLVMGLDEEDFYSVGINSNQRYFLSFIYIAGKKVV